MARISGVNIPSDKRTEVALTYIYGIGLTTSQKILKKSGVSPDVRVKDLSEDDLNKIRKEVEILSVEGELKRERAGNVKRLKEIKCYRGIRHAKGLPVRGQKTKTNSRTVRGNKRVTMGSGKAPAAQKT